MSELGQQSLGGKIVHACIRRYKTWELKVRQLLGAPTVRSYYGPRFVANYADITFRFYIKSSYGFFYWDRIAALQEPFIFLDIGANQGLYAVGAALNPHCQRVYAFEPVSAVSNLLQQNIDLNQVQDRCEVVRKAVTNHREGVTIRLNPTHSGSATIADGNNSHEGGHGELVETLDAKGLDDLIEARDLPIIVKIDVEGHEQVVIEQLLKSAFANQIREIFYEVDERWVKAEVLSDQLMQAGFKTQKIGRKKHYDVLAERQ